MAGTKRSREATKQSEMRDRPRERARIAEEKNRNLELEITVMAAKLEYASRLIALLSIKAGALKPREWIAETTRLAMAELDETLTEGDKQETD